MRLSWNEVRARAAAFAEERSDAAYEKGETQSFYNEFFGEAVPGADRVLPVRASVPLVGGDEVVGVFVNVRARRVDVVADVVAPATTSLRPSSRPTHPPARASSPRGSRRRSKVDTG